MKTPRATRLGKARGGDSGQDKELSETERDELERLRKENMALRMGLFVFERGAPL